MKGMFRRNPSLFVTGLFFIPRRGIGSSCKKGKNVAGALSVRVIKFICDIFNTIYMYKSEQ